MLGDVNIFLTDPTDQTLAELEIMIAGDALRLGAERFLHISWYETDCSCVPKCLVLKLNCFCFFPFLMVTEPSSRGKGLGKEVTRMMMCYGEQFKVSGSW